jgi:hypothetical protein
VAELVDAPDSKSGDGNIVLVRVRPGAPSFLLIYRGFFRLPRRVLSQGFELLTTRLKKYQTLEEFGAINQAVVERHTLTHACTSFGKPDGGQPPAHIV